MVKSCKAAVSRKLLGRKDPAVPKDPVSPYAELLYLKARLLKRWH